MNTQLIIQGIDEFLIYNNFVECTPNQVSEWLDRKGILKDNKSKKGLPLRNILRSVGISHAYQIGRHWHIPLSNSHIKKHIVNAPLKFNTRNETKDYKSNTMALAPLVCNDSQILILGTLPGQESLKAQQYYNNKRNRFWKILASLFNEQLPNNYHEKIELLKRHNIALWDVLHSAQREGSIDLNITDEVPNDLNEFLNQYPNIRIIALNGSNAYKMFVQNFGNTTSKVRIIKLLSSSPANCSYTEQDLINNWQQILE